ncbi:MAG: outer membrane beta-barrel protein [Deltaproteobacteria bacterium]|nr:outer membrane beta-barrel protein [Deltaproteobacteria bacterium]
MWKSRMLATLALAVLQPDDAWARSEEAGTGLSIGAKAGAAIPTSKLDATWLGAIDLSFRLPILGRHLAVAAEVSYLEPNESGAGASQVAGDYDYDLDQRVLTISLDALALVPVGRLTPYAGVGYGAYFLRAKMDAFSQENTETQTRAGLQLRGGLGYRLGPGDLVGEVRYHFVDLEFLSTGSSNAGAVTVAGGYRFHF